MSNTSNTVSLNIKDFNNFKSIMCGVAELQSVEPDHIVHRFFMALPEEHYGSLHLPESYVNAIATAAKAEPEDLTSIHKSSVTDALDKLREKEGIIELDNIKFTSQMSSSRHGGRKQHLHFINHKINKECVEPIIEQVQPFVNDFCESTDDLYDELHMSLALFVKDEELDLAMDYGLEHGVPKEFTGQVARVKHIVPSDVRRRSFMIIELENDTATTVKGWQENGFGDYSGRKPYSPHITVLRTDIEAAKMKCVDFSSLTDNAELAAQLEAEFISK